MNDNSWIISEVVIALFVFPDAPEPPRVRRLSTNETKLMLVFPRRTESK